MIMAVLDLSCVVVPIIYQVHRACDGSSFATRKVEAKQKGLVVFTLIASFQKEEIGFEHQAAIMPDVPPPEQLLNLEEIRERRLTDPRIPAQYRNSVAKNKFRPWPIEMRVCEDSVSQHKLIQMRCGGSASQHKPSANTGLELEESFQMIKLYIDVLWHMLRIYFILVSA